MAAIMFVAVALLGCNCERNSSMELDVQLIKPLIDDLASNDEVIEQRANARLRELVQADARLVPLLITSLSDTRRNVRYHSVSLLGWAGSEAHESVPKLIRLLEDDQEDEAIRRIAANTLGLIGKAATPKLVKLLESHPDTFVRLEAAHGLSRNSPEHIGGVPALIATLADKDDELCVVARGSLVFFGTAAVPNLRRALSHDNMLIRMYCAEVLVENSIEYLPEVVPQILNGLRQSDRRVRRQAAYALGQLDWRQDAACKSFQRLLKSEEIDLLVKYLKDDDDVVRYSIAKAIAPLGSRAKPAVKHLTEALANENEYVRGYSAIALGRIGPDAAPAVSALIQLAGSDQSDEVVIAALISLGEIGPSAMDAIPFLHDALRDPRYDRGVVESTIRRIQRK